VPTDRGLHRLVTLLDGVVAFAITVLVLPLIEVLGDARAGRDLGPVLGDHIAQFGTFGLSLVVIARLRVAHHALGERVGAYDGPFVLVNLAWAFTVVLLPFATQVTAGYGAELLASGIYVGTITASSACSTALAVLGAPPARAATAGHRRGGRAGWRARSR
jgi:uncharacterized membrane protein